MGGGVAYDNVMTLIEAVETFNEAIAASSEKFSDIMDIIGKNSDMTRRSELKLILVNIFPLYSSN